MLSKLKNVLCTAVAGLLTFTAYTQPTVNPTSADARLRSHAEKRKMAESTPFAGQFRSIGPSVMSGRVVDLDVNPDDPTEFYVAYATGGLWHTVNNGQSFAPVFDSEDVIFMGEIVVHWPTRTIYVGTGEANASRSTYSGVGVYKSGDNGKTWTYCGLPESHHIGKILVHPQNPDIVWVAVTGHLYSPNKERGVYKSTDGGKSWKQTLYIDENTGAINMDLNPHNPNVLYATMWYKTRAAWNFVESGATSGIYKSTDGGDNWEKISGKASGLPDGNDFGRSGIVVFPKNPDILYSVIDNQAQRPVSQQDKDKGRYDIEDFKHLTKAEFARLDDNKLDSFFRFRRDASRFGAKMIKEQVAKGDLESTVLYDFYYVNTGFENNPVGMEVYRSDDAGKTWKKMNEKFIRDHSTFGYYFGKLGMSATDENKIVVMGIGLQMSVDGGKSFSYINKANTHADHHAIWINPKRDSHIIIGNDGGVNISYDNGDNWFKANSAAVGQFYTISVDNARPYRVYGGLQDNGVWSGFTVRQRTNDAMRDTMAFRSLGGGDGMMVFADPRDNKTVYFGSQFGAYSRSHLDTGGFRSVRPSHKMGEKPYRFNWLTPIMLSSHNPDMFYIGSNRLHRSMNKGENLVAISPDLTGGGKEGDVPFGTLTSISESPLRLGLLYAGTDDGNVHVSHSAGAEWKRIGENILPGGFWISRVIASRHKDGRVYVTLNGYRNDFFVPMVYMSEDFGTTWKNISGNLPMEPVNVIREDPKFPEILYVGTDGALYVSKNNGTRWDIWNKGMPHSVPVHDIAIQERENEILLGTHGRSIYVADLNPIHGLEPKKENNQRSPRFGDDEPEPVARPGGK